MKTSEETALSDADFFWVLRLLQTRLAGRVRVGESTQLRDDWCRLRQAPHYSHSTSPIESLVLGRDGAPDELRVRFFGLFGPNGGLPLHLTEMANDRSHHARDETLWRFVDLFHHRMLSLFFRAWAVHQPTVDFDAPTKSRYPARIAALIGLGQPSLTARDSWDDLGKIYQAGHLACPVRNEGGLAAVLGDFFEVPVQVLTFVGQWLDLPAASRCKLGASPATGALGRTTYAGEKIWDCQTKFRIRFGPVGWRDFKRFLPDGDSCRKLRDIVRFYAGFELAWDFQCVLRADEVPGMCLGKESRLGWTSWLQTRPPVRNAEDLILNLEPQAA